MIGLMCNSGSVEFFLHGEYVLWEVTAVLGNGCGIQGKNYVAWLQGSTMPVEVHYRNLILGI